MRSAHPPSSLAVSCRFANRKRSRSFHFRHCRRLMRRRCRSFPQPKPATLELYQPCPFGTWSVAALTIGDVRSMFSKADVVAELPALSNTVAETTWPRPSADTVTGAGHETMPERPGWSAHANDTVTAP